jgi:predicted nucleotide-binding protein
MIADLPQLAQAGKGSYPLVSGSEDSLLGWEDAVKPLPAGHEIPAGGHRGLAADTAGSGYTTSVSQQPAGAAGSPTAFFSYARVDASIVRAFAEELRLAGINVLLDTEFLRPGERFETVIFDKVRSADALVFFVSPSSLQSKWVEAELLAFSEASNKVIVPVLINGAGYGDLPRGLARYHGLIVENDAAIPDVARHLAAALAWQVSNVRPPESEKLSPEAGRRGADLAASIAADIRAPVLDPQRVGNSVFLVHGHDHVFRDEVDQYLQTLGIQPVILSKARGGSRSLLDRFEALATQASFAVVLMSPDDLGASREQYEYERGGKHTLKYRARENVILELGFFYGRLGWDHVFVVRQSAENPWPDFEVPSDIVGAVILETSAEVDWREELADKLRDAKLLVSG